jgi:hypothetical protein
MLALCARNNPWRQFLFMGVCLDDCRNRPAPQTREAKIPRRPAASRTGLQEPDRYPRHHRDQQQPREQRVVHLVHADRPGDGNIGGPNSTKATIDSARKVQCPPGTLASAATRSREKPDWVSVSNGFHRLAFF